MVSNWSGAGQLDKYGGFVAAQPRCKAGEARPGIDSPVTVKW